MINLIYNIQTQFLPLFSSRKMLHSKIKIMEEFPIRFQAPELKKNLLTLLYALGERKKRNLKSFFKIMYDLTIDNFVIVLNGNNIF